MAKYQSHFYYLKQYQILLFVLHYDNCDVTSLVFYFHRSNFIVWCIIRQALKFSKFLLYTSIL